MGDVILGIDFSAKRERDHAQFLIAMAISQAMAPDEVFVDENLGRGIFRKDLPAISSSADRLDRPDLSCEERIKRALYHGAGLPYPKDRA